MGPSVSPTDLQAVRKLLGHGCLQGIVFRVRIRPSDARRWEISGCLQRSFANRWRNDQCTRVVDTSIQRGTTNYSLWIPWQTATLRDTRSNVLLYQSRIGWHGVENSYDVRGVGPNVIEFEHRTSLQRPLDAEIPVLACWLPNVGIEQCHHLVRSV